MKRFSQILLVGAALFFATLVSSSFAFTGPGTLTPGTGSGALSVDPNQNLGFGTYSLNASLGTNYNTPPGGSFSKVFLIAATSSPPGVALRNIANACVPGDSTCTNFGLAPATWVMQTTPWGAFSIYNGDSTFSGDRNRFIIFPNGNVALGGISGPATSTLNVFGNVYSSGSFVGSLSGGLSAANVTGPSAFGANYGTYNFAMPGSLAVGTSTTVGLPAGGLFVVGNVGVGTASPGAKLDVVTASAGINPSANGDELVLQNTGNAGMSILGSDTSIEQIIFGRTSDNDRGIIRYDQNTDYMSLWTSTTQRLTIDASGNVGIGTTNPVTKLHVDGSSVAGPNSVLRIAQGTGTIGSGPYGLTIGTNALDLLNYRGLRFQLDSSGNGVMESYVAGAYKNLLLAPQGGNVGIATTTPAYTLDVVGTARFTQPVVVGTPISGTQAATKSYVDSAVVSSAGNWTLSGVNIYNSNSGNVGIGVASPTSKLSVYRAESNIPGDVTLGFNYNGVDDLFGFRLDTSHNLNLDANYGGWLATPVMTFQRSNGNVGIGTTATGSYKLSVNGTINATAYAGGTYTGTINATNVSAGAFGTNTGGGAYTFPTNLTLTAGNLYVNNTAGNAYIAINSGAAGTPYVSFQRNGTEKWELGPAVGGTIGDSFGLYGGTSAGIKMVVDMSGNVGIGTTSATNNLVVIANGASRGIDVLPTGYGSGGTMRIINPGVDNTLQIGAVENNNVQFLANNSVKMTLTTGGNLGVGTTGPAGVLEVKGNANVSAFGSSFANTVVINGTYSTGYSGYPGLLFESNGNSVAMLREEGGTGLSFYTGNSSSGGVAAMKILTNSNVGISTTTPVYTLDVVGTARFTQPIIVGTPVAASQAATKSYVDSIIGGQASSTSNYVLKSGDVMSGNLNMNGNNILGVGKLTVTTLDPLYQIAGAKYATYGASIAGGVKEEYVGKGTLTNVKAQIANAKSSSNDQMYQYVLDFDKVKQGSDLWVWHNVVDFSADNVEVLATPIGVPVAIAYQIEGNKIIFTSYIPHSTFDIPHSAISFSYRLIGKRFDWREHPTLAPDQSVPAGLIIK